MMGSFMRRLFGTSKDRGYKRHKPILDAVNGYEAEMCALSNQNLRAMTGKFKARLNAGETLEDILPEAFAVVREASKRVTGMRPFDVQIMGALVLHNGNIAEMVTGEGKTLVATLPLYLNALTGEGAHLVTVNDYLAQRDSQWMGPIFEFLALTVGLIQQHMPTRERQVAYRADITYGTNNEYGFDYLRDNMAIRPEMRVQRKLHYGIVDEVDSILIDEARTPLIISGRPEKSTELYHAVDEAVGRLRKEEDYECEEKGHHVLLTEEGMERIEKLMNIENLYSDESLSVVHMVEQSLKARNFYKRDDEYVVKDGEVYIVDEFTGRIMEGRRYSDGLHQALEAKEKLSIQFETQTVASITYQNFFKLYEKLSGMTGTAVTEAVEFSQIYDLEVIQIPTNLPMRREDQTDLIFATEKGKFKYVVDEIERIRESGRPILVGTVSIEKSEEVSEYLKERGVKDFQVLNAKHHEREAVIVANAGKRGAITISTNMAGRGTDIKLAEGVPELGGLAIIGTERHESRRIDNQLRGRSGRQGDAGTTRFYVSLEDKVARLFGGDRVKKFIGMFGGDQMDEEPLDQRMVTRSIERAQRQVEEYNYEIRKHLVEYDDVMNMQRKVIYELRRDVLEDRDITERLHEMIESLVVDIVENFAPDDIVPEEWDLDGLATRFKMTFGFEAEMSEEDSSSGENVESALLDAVVREYERRESLIADDIRDAYREQVGGDESHINFAKLARKRVHDLEMMALLRAVDDRWIDHLYSMDYLRESVRLRAYGQRDPLVEYKTEGFAMFQDLMISVYENVMQTLFRLTDPEVRRVREIRARKGTLTADDDPFAQLSNYTYVAADKEQDESFASYDTSRFNLAGQSAAPAQQTLEQDPKRRKPQTVRRTTPKVKPNDPCPCGSKKKYKKCHGRVEH